MNSTQQEQNVKQVNTVQSQSANTQQQTPSSSPQTYAPSSQEGFNLIPAMTKEEKYKIKKKNTFNISSILSIIVLASIAIAIVGFNILSKVRLNSKKNTLTKKENLVYENIDKISTNNAILERAKLYDRFKKGSFSHKRIIEFLEEIAGVERGSKRGSISFTKIEISEDLSFEASGSAPSLEQVAYMWYLFGINENVEDIMLNSVSKTDEGSNFSFEGTLNISNFSNE
jgi:hypothetical protein